jgi:uncharacterized protein (DUF58 family)
VIDVDEAAIERAAAGLRLRMPRAANRGKVGEVRASSVGSSMELHDFRQYQPGDDVRHVDWNAVARTGEVVIRVRREEVSPRLEVVLDASKSMAVSDEKAARATEVAMWTLLLGQRAGLDVAAITAGAAGAKATGSSARAALRNVEMNGTAGFDEALRRAPPLRACGLRIVVSDLLFEAAAGTLVERLARGASQLFLIQVLDAEDLDPSGGTGARLVDAESGEFLDRILVADVLGGYLKRFETHQRMWRDAARRVGAVLVTVPADEGIVAHARGALAPLTEVA